MSKARLHLGPGAAFFLLAMAGCSRSIDPSPIERRESQLQFRDEIEADRSGGARPPEFQGGAGALEDYLGFAQSNNPGLRASFERWKAAVERIPQVTALPEPKLMWMHFIDEIQTRTGPQENRYSISQVFPWFGKLGLQGEAAAARAEAMWWEVEAKRLEVAREVKLAYFEYAYLAQAIRIGEENLSLLHSLDPLVQRRVQTGAGQGDLLRLQVEIGRAENDLAALRGFRPALSARLRALLNAPSEELLPWPAPVEDLPGSTPRGDLRTSLVENNPRLQALRRQIEAGELQIERARLEGRPDFTLGFDYFDTEGAATAVKPSDSGADPYGFSIGITLPIWRSKYAAGAREAEALRSALEGDFVARRNELIAELELRGYELDDAARQVSLFRDTLIPRARQALALTQVAYVAGASSVLDLIDRQRELLSFEKSYWRSLSNHRQRLADLETLIGGPLP
jgi:outer membrane protein TolC